MLHASTFWAVFCTQWHRYTLLGLGFYWYTHSFTPQFYQYFLAKSDITIPLLSACSVSLAMCLWDSLTPLTRLRAFFPKTLPTGTLCYWLAALWSLTIPVLAAKGFDPVFLWWMFAGIVTLGILSNCFSSNAWFETHAYNRYSAASLHLLITPLLGVPSGITLAAYLANRYTWPGVYGLALLAISLIFMSLETWYRLTPRSFNERGSPFIPPLDSNKLPPALSLYCALTFQITESVCIFVATLQYSSLLSVATVGAGVLITYLHYSRTSPYSLNSNALSGLFFTKALIVVFSGLYSTSILYTSVLTLCLWQWLSAFIFTNCAIQLHCQHRSDTTTRTQQTAWIFNAALFLCYIHFQFPHNHIESVLILLPLLLIQLGFAYYFQLFRTLPIVLAIIRRVTQELLKLIVGLKINNEERLYRPHNQPVITVGNHVSLFDTLIVGSSFTEKLLYPITPLWCKRWYVQRIFCELGELYPVEPSDARSLLGLIKALRKGGRCMIYPEGGLSRTGNLMRLHDGTASLIDLSSASVQSFMMVGAHQLPTSVFDGRSRVSLRAQVRVGVSRAERFKTGDLKGKSKRSYVMRCVLEQMHRTHLEAVSDLDMFEALCTAHARYDPKRTLFMHHDWSLSLDYATLIKQARCVSWHLQFHNPSFQKTPIGLYLKPGCQALSALFGIFHAQAVACPIATTHSDTFIRKRITELGITTIIVSYDLLEPLEACLEGLSVTLYSIDTILAPHPMQYLNKLNPFTYLRNNTHYPSGVLFLHPSGTHSFYTQQQLHQHTVQCQLYINLEGHDISYNASNMDDVFGLVIGTLVPLIHGVSNIIETTTLSPEQRMFRLEELCISHLVYPCTLFLEDSNHIDSQKTLALKRIITSKAPTISAQKAWENQARCYVHHTLQDPTSGSILALTSPLFAKPNPTRNAQYHGHLLPATQYNDTQLYPPHFIVALRKLSGVHVSQNWHENTECQPPMATLDTEPLNLSIDASGAVLSETSSD